MQKKSLHQNQQGMVAIMVAIFLTVIVSLLVVNYTRYVQREQRQTLDRQLNTQAFYAAESGINDATEVVTAAASAGNPIPEKSDCAPNSDYAAANILDPVSGSLVSYSCLLVDATLPSVEFDAVSKDASTVFQMSNNAAGGDIDQITFSWAEASGGTDISSCPSPGSFPASGSYPNPGCDIGLLRIDIVPLVNPNRASLINDTVTVFGVPGSGGGSVNASAASGLAGQGAIVRGNCGSSGCSVTVQGLGEQAYGVRLRGIYEDARVTVTAVDSSNNPVEISGAQVMIDSTGKANDVLRRVQVRLPLASSAGSIPDFAIQTTDTLCKRLQVATTIINVDTSGTGTIDTSACQVAP